MSGFIVSEIRDAAGAIKAVLSKADEAFMLYCFEDGQLKAMNRNMRAGIPIMFEENMVLSAGDFDRALKVIRSDPEVIIGPNHIVFTAGKTRIQLPRLEATFEIKVEDIVGTEVDLDDQFIKKLQVVTPLLEDAPAQDWMNSVVCINGKMITTSKGQFMLAADYEPFADEDVRCLLPIDAVKFLVGKKDQPSELIVNPNAAQFKYPDDSWVTTSLFTGKVPGKLIKLLEDRPEDNWEPTEEHKAIIKDCLTLGANRVVFDDNTLTAEVGLNTGGNVVFEVPFPTPEGRKMRWNPKHLDLAFSVGNKFDFTTNPDRAIFSNDGLIGIIAPMIM